MPQNSKSTRSDHAKMLMEAFAVFTEASSKLEMAYRQLQEHARQISRELAETNAALERNLAEKERVKNYLHEILESLPCGVLVVDPQGIITICNRVAASLLGISDKAALLGQHHQEVLNGHPIKEQICSSIGSPEAQIKDLEVEVASDGGQGMVLAVSSSAVRSGAGGQICGVIFILRDLTQIKRLQEQSRRVERLRAMGEMAVELAHEIRNPLASIELLSSLLCKGLKPGSQEWGWASQVQVGVRSLNNIVSNMLNFTRELDPMLLELDVCGLLDEALGFIDPVIRQKQISVIRSYSARPIKMLADRDLLKQAFLNIILNALQAMPCGGKLRIAVRDYKRDNSIGIEFRDNGVGIAPGNLERIFDPFFTTNKTGTGLGLAVVDRIVRKHRGTISVKSRLNRGTTFAISFPKA